MLIRALAILAALLALILGLVFWSYQGTVSQFPDAGKVIALTYDDGPNPPDTQVLLEALEEHGVKATFFLKGRNIEAFPESVRAVVAAGHEVANHSYHHRAMLLASTSEALAEIRRTNDLIEEVVGIRPRVFRPPYGAQGPGLKLALDELGMISILMSDVGNDWELDDPGAIADKVLQSAGPGSVILLHDGHGDVDDPASQNSRAATVEATDIIIRTLKAQGYQFLTVNELLVGAGR